MNPADELRTAAHKLRQAAEAARIASPLPWAVTDEHVVRCADESIVVDRRRTTNPRDRGDLPYIGAMHPGVGAALADWLDHAARYYDAGVQAADEVFRDDPDGRAAFLAGPGAPSEHALAVARQINGGQP